MEEATEFKAEVESGNKKNMEAEMGDLLFSLVNVARLYDIHPDDALELTNQKFIRRFNHIEQRSKEIGKSLKDMTLAEMDSLWNEAKQK